MTPLHPPPLQVDVRHVVPMVMAWIFRADALATCRAPTMMPIYVIFLLVANWTFLWLIITLSWELRAGMRSIRPKGRMLEASFTIYDVFALNVFQDAGAAPGSWFVISSAQPHHCPGGQAGVASSGARTMMLLAALMAGCLTGPMARAPARRLPLRSSLRRVDGASGCRAAMRATACPSPSTADALLLSHRTHPWTCRCATRLPARGAGRRAWVTASAKASSQKDMRPGGMKGRRRRGAGECTQKESMRRKRPARRKAYIRGDAEVGVTELVLASGSAVTSTSARP